MSLRVQILAAIGFGAWCGFLFGAAIIGVLSIAEKPWPFHIALVRE